MIIMISTHLISFESSCDPSPFYLRLSFKSAFSLKKNIKLIFFNNFNVLIFKIKILFLK